MKSKHSSTHTPGHETLSIDTRQIWLAGAALAATVVAVLAIVAGLMFLFTAGIGVTAGEKSAAQLPTPPGVPQLDAHQPQERRRLRERQERWLSTYGWVDPRAGIARIPIERAIDQVVANGLPQPPSQSPTQTPPQPPPNNSPAPPQ